MNMTWRSAILIGALASSNLAAAQSVSSDSPYEVTLDFDGNGSPDRVVVLRDAANGVAEVRFYLDAGDGKFDQARKPTFVKKDLTVEGVLWVESKPRGSLALTYGCGGCSNDYETTLTIAYRQGEFLVAGYTYSWETRESAGSC